MGEKCPSPPKGWGGALSRPIIEDTIFRKVEKEATK
jgi:hypothetical protein